MFDIGQLIWVWIKGDEPISGLIVEVLEGGFYNVLVEEQIHKLSDDRIWHNKEECIKPPPFFPYPRRIFPGLIASQMITVQPMSLPSGLLFYLDNMSPSGSKDEEEK
jgi:hypothetical protein